MKNLPETISSMNDFRFILCFMISFYLQILYKVMVMTDDNKLYLSFLNIYFVSFSSSSFLFWNVFFFDQKYMNILCNFYSSLLSSIFFFYLLVFVATSLSRLAFTLFCRKHRNTCLQFRIDI